MRNVPDTPAPDCPICNNALDRVFGWKGWGRRLHDVVLCLSCGTALDRHARPVRALTQRDLLGLLPGDADQLHHVQQAIRSNGKIM